LTSPMEYLVYLRGATSAQLAVWQAPNIKAVNTPVQLGQALAQCDAVLSYGGMGMTSATLMAGKPSVYITRDLEGHITARMVEKLGAGLHLNGHQGQSLGALLRRVIQQPEFAKAAQAFAAKHHGHSAALLSAKILDQLSEILELNAPEKDCGVSLV
jgi:UDP:flavonoid glycosyltransferase YjiC (YdhE family)